MLFGFLFQQLYNTVDSVVVGNFVGKEVRGRWLDRFHHQHADRLFSGLATGASVVIARLFGARDDAGVSKAVHTTVVMTLFLALLFTALGVAMVPSCSG